MEGPRAIGRDRRRDLGRGSLAADPPGSVRHLVVGLLVLALTACSAVTDSAPPMPTPSTSGTSSPVPSPSPTTGPPTSTPTTPGSPPPTVDGSGPPPGPVVTVTPVEPLPDGGVDVRLRPGEPTTVADGVTVELVALEAAEAGCDDCPNRATILLSTPDAATQADITIGGLMEPSVLEADRRLQVGSWVVRVEAFGNDHVDVRVVDLDG